MPQSADKKRWFGPSLPRQFLTEEEVERWYAQVQAIREAKRPKRFVLPEATLIPPKTQEVLA